MPDGRERQLLDGGLRFFGRIMAGLSHDINNIISIVAELSGLLRDYAALADRGRPLDIDKLKSVLDNFDKQVSRGKALITGMNRFAHSIDNPVGMIQMDSLLADMVRLGQRFADRKGAHLAVNNSADALTIRNNPFLVRQAIFLCLDMILDGLEDSGSIVISQSACPGGISLLIQSPVMKDASGIEGKFPYLELVMEELKGEAKAQALADGTHLFTLTLPSL